MNVHLNSEDKEANIPHKIAVPTFLMDNVYDVRILSLGILFRDIHTMILIQRLRDQIVTFY